MLLGLGGIAFGFACTPSGRRTSPSPSVDTSLVLGKPGKPAADGGLVEPIDAPAWSADGQRLGYFRGDVLIVVDVRRLPNALWRLPLPPFEFRKLSLLTDGGALVIGNEAASEPFHIGKKHLLVVSPSGTLVRSELLGTENAISPPVIDEETDSFASFVQLEPQDGSAPVRVDLDVRGLRKASPSVRTRMPDWFQGDVGAGPKALGCKGPLCAFGVKRKRGDHNDAELLLAFVDVRRRQTKLLGVTLGASGDIAFAGGANTLVAAMHGPEADPVIIETKTWATRPLGRRGAKGDYMQPAGCVAFSSDGALVAAASQDDPVSLFDVKTGKRRWPTAPLSTCIASSRCAPSFAYWRSCRLVFSRDDASLLDVTDLGNAQKLAVTSGRKTNEHAGARIRQDSTGPRAVGNESWLTSGALSPWGTYFVVVDVERGRIVLDTRSWTNVVLPGSSDSEVVFSPDDRFAVVDDRIYALEQRGWSAKLP